MIRKATPQDFPYILDLYMKGLEELGEHYLESMCLKKVVLSYHLAPCFLLVDCDNIIGIAGLTTVTSSHNGDATLSDYMFYVLPEHRNKYSFDTGVEVLRWIYDNEPSYKKVIAQVHQRKKSLLELS